LGRQELPAAFRFDLGRAHAGLAVEQLQLRVAEPLALGSVLFDALQSQLFFQHTDQLSSLQLLSESFDLFGFRVGLVGEWQAQSA
jgi:hypothetical protein